MTTGGNHPRYRLDEVIHAPVRLSIMSALAAADRVDFRFLRELVEVSDSLLSKHMTLLEDARYVEVIKGYQGKRPRTWFTLTDTRAGRLRRLPGSTPRDRRYQSEPTAPARVIKALAPTGSSGSCSIRFEVPARQRANVG